MSFPASSYSYPTPPVTPTISSQSSMTRYERAPALPCVPLPPCDEPYYELLRPTSTPPRIHPVLSSRPTAVLYDFTTDPQTIKMVPLPSPFPCREAASDPLMAVLNIRCELTGHLVTIRRSTGITCKDILVEIHRFFDRTIPPDEWRKVRGSQRDAMKVAYTHRTGRLYDRTSQLKMVDYLMDQSVFKHVVPFYGHALGSMWLLQTTSSQQQR